MTGHDRPSEPHALASETHPLSMMAARVDLLSQMLTLIRLQGELVFSAELTHPWSLQFEAGAAYFHVVSEGRVVVQVGDEPPIHASTGDLLMLPHGTGHIVSDGGQAAPASANLLLTQQLTTERLSIRHGGNGELTRMITGIFRFESQTMPTIMAALPSIIHIPKTEGDGGGWLEGLAYFLLVEAHAPHPGASLMISRLIDVLVIRTLRTWAQTAEPGNRGWLGALADPRISRALKAIHDEPFRRWSVADLAGVAGMSRSSFAERFATLVGEPPLQYQTRWRLTLAIDMLRRGDRLVGDVAREIGYDSDAAFSRAFKAQFGYAPVNARHV